MKKVRFNGKVLTKKLICEHICNFYYYVPLDKFLKYKYLECKRILHFLVLTYRPNLKDDYENLFF